VSIVYVRVCSGVEGRCLLRKNEMGGATGILRPAVEGEGLLPGREKKNNNIIESTEA
jgi:hypothetical protein